MFYFCLVMVQLDIKNVMEKEGHSAGMQALSA